MKLAPSKNPEQESKLFGILSLTLGIGSLFLWFLGLVAIGPGVRGIILSKRVKNTRNLTFSIIGLVLGLVSLVYYYSQ